MKALLGDPDVAGLNTTVLDATAQLKDIQATCEAMPFLSDKRLVVVRGWLSRPAPKRKTPKTDAADSLSQLVQYVPGLPEFTALVFVEDGTLPAGHPLIRLAQDKSSRGRAKFFDLPKDVPRWIDQRARSKGGEISPAAARLLSTKINRGDKYDRDHFDEDNRLYLYKLDHEIDKLVAYAAGRRVEEPDVALLVADEQVADMFGFVDALSTRDAAAAYRIMRGVLARGETPLIVLSMIARQTRLLIQARENERLSPDELAGLLGVHPFVARKLAQQAGHFSLDELVQAHIAAAEADFAVKTGKLEDVTALDVLVAGLCQPAGAGDDG